MKIQDFCLLFLLVLFCDGNPLLKENLPHSRDYYAGYIKAITDNFDQLFPGERKARSTHDDEKEKLFAELLNKNTQRGKVETLADIKHFQGGDSKLLMEMKRDVESQEGYPDIDSDVQNKPHLRPHHHHHHRHKIPHYAETKASIPLTTHANHILQNKLPLTKAKVETVLPQNKTVNSSLHKTLDVAHPKINTLVKQNVKNITPLNQSINPHKVNETRPLISKKPLVVKEVLNINTTTPGQLSSLSQKRHRKTAAHKKYILSRFLEPEETAPGPRREYILEHGDRSSLPLYQGTILNYQDSNPPPSIGGEFDQNDGGEFRSPYDRGYGPQFPSQFGGDMYGGQFFPPQNEHPMGGNFMDSFGENTNMNNGYRFGGMTPDMQYSEFNNGFAPQRGHFSASLPTMSNMEKNVYENVQGGNSMFSPDNEGPQYPQFGTSQTFSNGPNPVSFNGMSDDEADVNQQDGPVGLPTDKSEYEDVKEDERVGETELGETRSKIKKARKESHKKKQKKLKRCGVFNERPQTITENRILTPACNPDGSCTLVPSKDNDCLNAMPLNPDIRPRPINFPSQVPLIPVLIPAPFGQPFPISQLNRFGNTVCRNCIFPPMRELKFLIVPLMNGRIFNGPPCNADLLSPYLG